MNKANKVQKVQAIIQSQAFSLSALAIVLSALNFLPLPARAQDGKAVVQNLVSLMSLGNGNTQKPGIYAEAAKDIDFETMAELSVSSNVWNKLTTLQKNDFSGLLRKLVEERYYPRWHKIFSRGKVAYVGETGASKDIYVKTDLTIGKKQNQLVWRLHPRAGELKIISLSVGSKDLLDRASVSFHKRLAKGSFDELTAWLKDKLDDDQGPNAGTTTASELN